MIRFLLTGLFVLATSAPLAAQIIAPPEVSFTGVVEKADGFVIAAICAPPTHQLACSDGTYFLYSSTLDLDQYLGKNVKLYGSSLEVCPLYNVHKVEVPPPATLAICGTGGFGCPIRLRSGPGGISQHALFVSLAPGLVPLNPSKGSFLLAEPFYLLGVQVGGFPGEGAAFDFTIPGAPVLAGVTL
ncbi:MAG TPA: hypothetical protein VFD43_06905 [Planctomycetota bacterium]|nr:hypothetical protein [Planctomycetota bacterium]